MLDYKNFIIKRYALILSFKQLAEEFNASKSGVNDFIRAFEKCDKLSYPLPEGITNYLTFRKSSTQIFLLLFLGFLPFLLVRFLANCSSVSTFLQEVRNK